MEEKRVSGPRLKAFKSIIMFIPEAEIICQFLADDQLFKKGVPGFAGLAELLNLQCDALCGELSEVEVRGEIGATV